MKKPYFDKDTTEITVVFIVLVLGVYTGLAAMGFLTEWPLIIFMMKLVGAVALGIAVVMILMRAFEWLTEE